MEAIYQRKKWHILTVDKPLHSSRSYVPRTFCRFSWIDSRSLLHSDPCVICCGQTRWKTSETRRRRNTLLTIALGVAHIFTGELIVGVCPWLMRYRAFALDLDGNWLFFGVPAWICKIPENKTADENCGQHCNWGFFVSSLFAAMQRVVISYNRTTYFPLSEHMKRRMQGKDAFGFCARDTPSSRGHCAIAMVVLCLCLRVWTGFLFIPRGKNKTTSHVFCCCGQSTLLFTWPTVGFFSLFGCILPVNGAVCLPGYVVFPKFVC